MNRAQKRELRAERNTGRKHPSRYRPAQLREMVVTDACDRVGVASAENDVLHLSWTVLAIDRIAKHERKHVDVVFQEIEGEVFARSGHGMPL
jgi:hypothetical protein